MEENGINNKQYWVWFNLLKIENNTKVEMLKRYNIIQIYHRKSAIAKKFKMNNIEAQELYKKEYIKIAKKVCEYNSKNNIGMINILDKAYPMYLKNIYNPPIVLYYKGNKKVLNNMGVSIFVGKNIDNYGKEVYEYLSKNLIQDKIPIVTKFEEYDKQTFLNNVNNNNILVLSTGIKENVFASKAVILSEYEPYINSDKNTIIKRNRIITGLTKETVLIQMEISDGAGYIVDTILQQNREIWVVPADIFKIQNFYTNELLKQGVNILTHHNNLLVYEQRENKINMLTANKYY